MGSDNDDGDDDDDDDYSQEMMMTTTRMTGLIKACQSSACPSASGHYSWHPGMKEYTNYNNNNNYY